MLKLINLFSYFYEIEVMNCPKFFITRLINVILSLLGHAANHDYTEIG